MPLLIHTGKKLMEPKNKDKSDHMRSVNVSDENMGVPMKFLQIRM